MKNTLLLLLLTAILSSCSGPFSNSSKERIISYEFDGEYYEHPASEISIHNALGTFSIGAQHGQAGDEDYSDFGLVFTDPPADSMFTATNYSLSLIYQGMFFIDAPTNEELIILENSEERFRAEFSFDQRRENFFDPVHEIRNGRVDLEK